MYAWLKHLFLTDWFDSSSSSSSSEEESSSESKGACGNPCCKSVDVDYSVTKGACCSYCNTGKPSVSSSSSSSDSDSDDLGELLDDIFK